MTSTQTTGVWVSGDAARIVEWSPSATVSHSIKSGVPGRRRSTGRPPTAHLAQADGLRDERFRAFFDRVMRALPDENDLLLLGDGEVVLHLAELVRADDERRGALRRVEVSTSAAVTERQLVARIRDFAGHPAPRRTVR